MGEDKRGRIGIQIIEEENSRVSQELNIAKNTFLSERCKEIEENNIIGKTRDHLKKIGNTKGTFHAKMATIGDRNGITEAEDIKKR